MAQIGSIKNRGPSPEMIIDAQEIEIRKKNLGITSADLKRLATVKEILIQNVSELTKIFFDHLALIPEARTIFENPTVLEEARSLKREHLLAMAEGEYGVYYVEQRLRLGRLYGKCGLDINLFLSAFHYLIKGVGGLFVQTLPGSSQEVFEHYASFEKIAFFDIGIIVDVLVYDRERTIRQQQEAIRELSTPVLQLRERLLILPIVGMIDTYRARLLTENLLKAIRSARAKVVVIDITGVAAVDSKVANHIVQTVAACRLMGAQVIVTGLSAEVAQTLVTLGVDLFKLNTVGDLQGGIEEAERILGYKVVQLSGDNGKSAPQQGIKAPLEV